MPSDPTGNDALLQPFLMAKDLAESQRQLTVLLSKHAEPIMKGIIKGYLNSYFSGQDHRADFEDLCSEAKIRLVTYLHELRSDRTAAPCRDFLGYAATIARNACHDYARQKYPLLTRLRKKIRDFLRANSNFAVWEFEDKNRGDWLCGFQSWRGLRVSSASAAWIRRFYENPETTTEALASDGDIQWMDMADLLAAIFKDVGEPLRLTDVVNLVSDLRGVKDFPVASFEADAALLSLRLPDPKVRIDSLLEMREPLKRYWQGLCKLPRDEFRVHLLCAQDTVGDEDMINLLLDAEVTTKGDVAALLGMTQDEFLDLRLNWLPLDNKAISKQLGITINRVYKLRFQAGKRVKLLLAEINLEEESQR